MQQNTINICDKLRGFDAGRYYFIVEGNRLIHISRYTSIREKRGNEYCYTVSTDLVKSKQILEFQ